MSPEHSLEGLMLKLNSSNLATWCEELTHLKRPWCWERLEAGREGDNRGWDGWMASLTQWTLVWMNSRRWWWTGRPGMLWFVGSQRVRHEWANELTDWYNHTGMNAILTYIVKFDAVVRSLKCKYTRDPVEYFRYYCDIIILGRTWLEYVCECVCIWNYKKYKFLSLIRKIRF